jgi:chemotaxis protein CheZ
MPEPRKIFRIEETAAAQLARGGDGAQASLRHTEIMRTLGTLRALLGSAPPPPTADGTSGRTTERLACELNLIAGAIGGSGGSDDDCADCAGGAGGREELQAAHLTRIAHELNAVTAGSEQATQKILAVAEEIDQTANDLSAALKGKIERGLAQDISDLVIRIFEACNFQDLIGQRLGKVMTTLQFIEDHVARAFDEIKTTPPAWTRDAAQQLHGPRLDIDRGHLSQSEIDALFRG